MKATIEKIALHRSSCDVVEAAHLQLNVGCDVSENHMPELWEVYVLEVCAQKESRGRLNGNNRSSCGCAVRVQQLATIPLCGSGIILMGLFEPGMRNEGVCMAPR
jgi:hypothetical protein